MTIPTPTSDPAGIAALLRELYAAPGGFPLAGPAGTGSGVPGLQPPQGITGLNLAPSTSLPATAPGLAERAPALLPHAQAQNGLPDTLVETAPALNSEFGGAALGVPQVGTGLPLHTGASPFYFLDDFPGDTPPAVQPAAPYYFLEDGVGHPRGEPAAPGLPASSGSFDVHAVRRDFPILQERVNGRPLVWFDNAATTQKPRAVIDRLAYFYEHENSNIHRAAHELARRATDAYEGARSTVQRFIGASSPDEIVFVRGATEAINLIAKTWGAQNIKAGDEIIVSHLEHHANIVPWQQLAQQTGAVLRVIPVDDSGQVLLDEYAKLLNAKTRLVSVTQVSNALGTVVPVREIAARAHAAGALALVDGAQSVSHMRVNVQELDADFFVFSGHKIFGPTGIGAVYGKKAILDGMPPWQGGGNMIEDVTFERTLFQPPPNRLEAGTGNIADAAGLGAALDYVSRVGIDAIDRYEHALLEYALDGMRRIPGLRLIGTARDKASVLSFVLKGYETEEVGQELNREGIAVRAGHHCAQPILRRFGVEKTVRPSLAFYNTRDEVDCMLAVIRRLAGRNPA